MSMIIDGTNGLTFNNATTQASAGVVLQVVSTNINTTTSNASSSGVAATNLSVSITPKFSTSKILLIASVVATNSNGNGNYYFARNASVIGSTEKYTAAGGTGTQFAISMSYLDSPATTSSTSYQVYFNAGAGTQYVNQNGAYSTITALEIAA